MLSRSLSCAIVMGTEGFRSLAIFLSAPHSVTVYLRSLPPRYGNGVLVFTFVAFSAIRFPVFIPYGMQIDRDRRLGAFSIKFTLLLLLLNSLSVSKIKMKQSKSQEAQYCLSCNEQYKLFFFFSTPPPTVYNTTFLDSYPHTWSSPGPL